MNHTKSSPTQLDRLIESFMERQRQGERPSVEDYVRAHPELADEIRQVFAALELMEEFASTPGLRTVAPLGANAPGMAPAQQLGEFRIVREIGRGGMGIVYEAVQESLGRHVALKVLPAHLRSSSVYLQRFRREAQSAAKLHHTNIVPVFGVGDDNGVSYYAMQFIRGQTLESVLQELRPLRGKPSQTAQPHAAQGEGTIALSHVTESMLTGGFSVDAGRE